MRRTTRVWPVTPLLAVIVVLVTITVGVVVYQVVGRDDDIPGSAGGFDEPRNERGGAGSTDVVAAWAAAAAVGDYATAQRYMKDDVLYNMWQAQHSHFQNLIVGYQIVSQETVGQTTTAIVRFDLSRGTPACIPVLLDQGTQRIEVNEVYGACPGQP